MYSNICPYENGIKCDAKERLDEFYRQMQDAMYANKPVYFVTGGACAAYANECAKLRAFREAQQQKQK